MLSLKQNASPSKRTGSASHVGVRLVRALLLARVRELRVTCSGGWWRLTESRVCLLNCRPKLMALNSVQLLSDQFDSIQRRLENHDQEIKDVKHRVEKIEKSSGPQALAQLQLDVDALEWRSRRLNIEIHGIPDTDGEDLLSKVNDLAVRLEVGTLAGEDISAVHRLPARPGRTRGIIVRFARQELRDTWLAKRGVLRNSEHRVFICENMTSRSRGLLSAAKEWLKQSGYKYAWHANGKILVRRATGDSATIIKCEDDLRVLR
ncbi:unnamed protein product [Ixodes pacificus]